MTQEEAKAKVMDKIADIIQLEFSYKFDSVDFNKLRDDLHNKVPAPDHMDWVGFYDDIEVNSEKFKAFLISLVGMML